FGASDDAAGIGGLVAEMIHGEVPRTVGRGVDAPLDTRNAMQRSRDDWREKVEGARERSPMASAVGDALGTAAVAAPVAALAGPSAAAAVGVPLAFGALARSGASDATTLNGEYAGDVLDP